MDDTSGCPPTSSFFPPFIPTVIKRRFTSSRYAMVRTETSSTLPPRTMPFNTGDSTPRPSSSGSTSTARNSDDSFGSEDTGINRDVLAIGVPVDHEVGSGLRWNRVNPANGSNHQLNHEFIFATALNLLRHAGYEAQQQHCESRLVRSLYLNSMAYLLSALPEDLTSEEAETLRDSLPEKLKPSLIPVSSSHPDSPPYPAQRSYIHRSLATGIVYFCLLLQFLMPYIKEVMFHMYEYDRTHRVRERVTSLTLYVAEMVCRGGVNLGSTVLDMYDGKPGDVVSGTASWWLEGVAGGIYEGVGEGMVILGFSELDKENRI